MNKAIKASVVLASVAAVTFGTSMTEASASTGTWSSFSGIGSTWHCSATKATGWSTWVQDCIIVNGTSYQAALIFTTHADHYVSASSFDVQSDGNGGATTTGGTACAGDLPAYTTAVCFAPTLTNKTGNAVQGYAEGYVDASGSPYYNFYQYSPSFG